MATPYYMGGLLDEDEERSYFTGAAPMATSSFRAPPMLASHDIRETEWYRPGSMERWARRGEIGSADLIDIDPTTGVDILYPKGTIPKVKTGTKGPMPVIEPPFDPATPDIKRPKPYDPLTDPEILRMMGEEPMYDVSLETSLEAIPEVDTFKELSEVETPVDISGIKWMGFPRWGGGSGTDRYTPFGTGWSGIGGPAAWGFDPDDFPMLYYDKAMKKPGGGLALSEYGKTGEGLVPRYPGFEDVGPIIYRKVLAHDTPEEIRKWGVRSLPEYSKSVDGKGGGIPISKPDYITPKAWVDDMPLKPNARLEAKRKAVEEKAKREAEDAIYFASDEYYSRLPPWEKDRLLEEGDPRALADEAERAASAAAPTLADTGFAFEDAKGADAIRRATEPGFGLSPEDLATIVREGKDPDYPALTKELGGDLLDIALAAPMLRAAKPLGLLAKDIIGGALGKRAAQKKIDEFVGPKRTTVTPGALKSKTDVDVAVATSGVTTALKPTVATTAAVRRLLGDVGSTKYKEVAKALKDTGNFLSPEAFAQQHITKVLGVPGIGSATEAKILSLALEAVRGIKSRAKTGSFTRPGATGAVDTFKRSIPLPTTGPGPIGVGVPAAGYAITKALLGEESDASTYVDPYPGMIDPTFEEAPLTTFRDPLKHYDTEAVAGSLPFDMSDSPFYYDVMETAHASEFAPTPYPYVPAMPSPSEYSYPGFIPSSPFGTAPYSPPGYSPITGTFAASPTYAEIIAAGGGEFPPPPMEIGTYIAE